jgi:uncharacterized protein YdiU (UPF0061 family)
MTDPIAAAGWRFDNSYARLPQPLFAPASPVPVREPALVLCNGPLASDLGLDADVVRSVGATVFAGNALPPGAEPIAQAYAGHQFGHFTNLGDGRAIVLGEQCAPDGRRFDLQLKGAGRTRYSRSGDGRAALGPMLREYVVSEGMHALGVPTTRSLAVAATGERVLRETPLRGAVLTRVASSHIRVGTFQYAAALGDVGILAALLDHAIARHDPHLAGTPGRAEAFFEAVMDRQAALIARWMLVGFVHGVMNTDNMAVSGETIDYGPCAFLDAFDPATVFSSIDHQGRYAYANQPAIAHWNLARLAESLLPLAADRGEAAVDTFRRILGMFPEKYAGHHLRGARAKLGLATDEEGDGRLFEELLTAMHVLSVDFTETFADLAVLAEGEPSCGSLWARPPLRGWLVEWRARLERQPGSPGEAANRMRRTNPAVIPRNHRVEEALTAATQGSLEPLHDLLAAVTAPYDDGLRTDGYRSGPPPESGPYRTFCGT